MLVFLMGGGKGLKSAMERNFDGFAQNSCFLSSDKTRLAYEGFQSGRVWDLNNDDVKNIKEQVSGVDAVVGVLARWSRTYSVGDNSGSGTLKGVTPNYVALDAPHLKFGRFINESDVRFRRKVCVIGKRVREQLFPSVANPCGKYVCVDSVYYQVIGISNTSGNVGVMGASQTSVLIPYTTMQSIYNIGPKIDMLGFTAKAGFTVTQLQEQAVGVVKRAHHISPADNKAIRIMNLEAMFQMVDSLFVGINYLVWLIGIGTLFSGAVGVSNIMMVTVRERTSEIGIRRAIGAKPSTILKQIMAESVLLTMIAGLSGITFAVWLLQAVEAAMASQGNEASFQISFGMAVASMLAIALVGALAGLAPSFRALAIKPIDAIRDE